MFKDIIERNQGIRTLAMPEKYIRISVMDRTGEPFPRTFNLLSGEIDSLDLCVAGRLKKIEEFPASASYIKDRRILVPGKAIIIPFPIAPQSVQNRDHGEVHPKTSLRSA